MRRQSKLRGNRAMQRKPGTKPPRSITLVVCEGETEQAYFAAAREHFELSTAEIIIPDDADSAPISVVSYAERKCKEQGGYDYVFCVFDRDKHDSFDNALAKVRGLSTRSRNPLPLQAIVSVPCFEVWVMLHFERVDRPFARCGDVVNYIQRNLIPHYTKAYVALAKRLIDDCETAVTNAEWLDNRAADNDRNPSTTVHHVLRHFRSVKETEKRM